jgi:hypothetical protein
MKEAMPMTRDRKEPIRGRPGILADPSTDGTKKATGLTGPALRRFWDEFNTIGHALEDRAWTFARTMPWNPHWYTRRVHWDDDELFQWVVTELRLRGYRSLYGKTNYTQLNLNDHFYWTMGNIMNWPEDDPLTPGARMTAIINRKHIYGVAGHAPLFDTKEWDSRWLDRGLVERVFGHIGDCTGLRVLDVGCGDGHSLPFTESADDYLGLDPSRRMLNRLQYNWPWVKTLCTPLISFATRAYYDRVLALFGTGDYLTLEELARIPLLVGPGGQAFVMFNSDRTLEGFEPLEVGEGQVLWRYQG